MIEKALHLHADALVLDLEDSVPISEKASARAQVRDSLPKLTQQGAAGVKRKGRKVFVRINSIASGLAEDDL